MSDTITEEDICIDKINRTKAGEYIYYSFIGLNRIQDKPRIMAALDRARTRGVRIALA